MMGLQPPAARMLSSYGQFVAPALVDYLQERAAPLSGLRVLHLSAGPTESAVATTLRALVPLLRDLGIEAEWRIVDLRAPEGNLFYQGASGAPVIWRPAQRGRLERAVRLCAAELNTGYDAVVVHDPQLLGLAQWQPSAGRSWIWHCHLDLTGVRADHPALWDEIKGLAAGYDAAVFPARDLIPDELPIPWLGVARPGLDPLAAPQVPVPQAETHRVLARLGLDPAAPLIGQFSPIDERCAPLAALGTYWLARRHLPDLQLVLAELTPSGIHAYRPDLERVLKETEGDPRVCVLPASPAVNPTVIGALLGASTAVLQMAVPGGFGWGLAAGQWRGRPAIAGRYGMLPEQVAWGAAGALVEGAHHAAEAVVRLVQDPGRAAYVGGRGRARIQQRYLILSLLRDYLHLHRRIAVQVEPPYLPGERLQRVASGNGYAERACS